MDADAYPEMAEVLNQLATMQENAMLDEFDNLVSIAREELVADREGFETNVSTLDVQVRLVVFSLNADGSVTKTGEMNVSPSWLADNKFIVPTDPGMLILDDADSGTEKAEFDVGNDGMPSKT